MYDLILKNGTLINEGRIFESDIAIKGDRIEKIASSIDAESKSTVDLKGKYVIPGLIDDQVHFREPGSTDAEDLESGSRAAVLGGVTSLFEMPNTNPPTANLIEFDKKLKSSKKIECTVIMLFILEQHQTTQISLLI